MTRVNIIPEKAIWRGPPSTGVIRLIQSLTAKDSQDRLYYLVNGGWKRLRTDADYAELNRLVADGKERLRRQG